MLYAIAIVLSYLLGSLPTGLGVGRLFKGVDVRQYGSGNIGTANVLRTVGLRGGAVVLALDVSKGVGAVVLARFLADSEGLEAASALSALAGHSWPVFLGFKGGRGVATGLGGLLVIGPVAGVVALISGLAVMGLSRYVSLGSVVGVLVAFVAALTLTLLGYMAIAHLFYVAIGVPIILYRSRGNIRRLIQGNELKIGRPAEKKG